MSVEVEVMNAKKVIDELKKVESLLPHGLPTQEQVLNWTSQQQTNAIFYVAAFHCPTAKAPHMPRFLKTNWKEVENA